MDNAVFQIQLKVRDYECDLQGIVNNSVYQNYLEHCRHEFLASLDISFADLSQNQGIDLVVTRVELDYKSPLRSRDECIVDLKCERISKVRNQFYQTIRRVSDGKLVVNAIIQWAAVNDGGRPFHCHEIDKIFESQCSQTLR